jgi:hypothetical protein
VGGIPIDGRLLNGFFVVTTMEIFGRSSPNQGKNGLSAKESQILFH